MIFVLMAASFFLGDTSFAEESNWWNENWQYRKKITFDTTQTGSDIKENLVGIPVLLRLHSGNLDFTKALENGSDIRFVKADDKTELKHHIEYYDTIDEMALVWVNVPMISGASKQDYIWMYYGNKNAMGGQDAGGTYDANQVAVYHLGEAEGSPSDSTSYKNNVGSVMATQGMSMVIGNGISMNGAGDRIIIPSSPSLNFKDGITFSTWIKIRTSQNDACLFAVKSKDQTLDVRINGTKIYTVLKEGEKVLGTTEQTVDISLDAWHNLAVTAGAKQRMTVFLDSLKMTWTDIESFKFETVTDMVIGSDVNSGAYFSGDLDEINISNVIRSDAWIRGLDVAEGPESLLAGFGDEEMSEGGGEKGLYLSTIIKNITIDTIVIIAILTVFAMISWIIMISKGYNIWLMERDNKDFVESFKKTQDLMGLENKDDEFGSSPLYSLYLDGCREVKALVGDAVKNNRRSRMTRNALEAVKISIERVYMKETHKLNAWIVFLTMAITGGPFLGLLGTVWGVMNVFASLAEAGEASIMAVAPGVSSALAATVCGLLVAIPALFGYNYLTGGIKRISGDMDLFISEFIAKLEQEEEQ